MQPLELSSNPQQSYTKDMAFLEDDLLNATVAAPFLPGCTVHSDHFRSILHFGRAGHSQRGQGQYRSQLCPLGSVADSPALGIQTCEKLVGGTSVWCKPRWPRWRYLLDLPGGCLGISMRVFSPAICNRHGQTRLDLHKFCGFCLRQWLLRLFETEANGQLCCALPE